MLSTGLATSANAENEFCSIHAKKRILFICMDTTCNQNPNVCVLCVKKNHSLCNDKFLKDKDNFLNEVKIKNVTTSDIEGFKERILGILQEKELHMVQKYQEYILNSLNFLGSESSIDNLNTVSALTQMKKKCKITLKDDDTFEVSPSFEPSSPNLEEDLETFEEDIDKVLENFEKDLNKVKLKQFKKISMEDFVWHDKLSKFYFFLI